MRILYGNFHNITMPVYELQHLGAHYTGMVMEVALLFSYHYKRITYLLEERLPPKEELLLRLPEDGL